MDELPPPASNLARTPHDYDFRFELLGGEVLWGTLLDVTPDGISSIRTADGAVVHRECSQMIRLTELGVASLESDTP